MCASLCFRTLSKRLMHYSMSLKPETRDRKWLPLLASLLRLPQHRINISLLAVIDKETILKDKHVFLTLHLVCDTMVTFMGN